MARGDDKMTMRLGPAPGVSGLPPAHLEEHVVQAGQPMKIGRPPFRIEIRGQDEALLLVFREQDGYLVIEGDESRWTEGAMRFLQQMRQWSGQVGLRWPDEVEKAAGES
jgi:hypothetical protein